MRVNFKGLRGVISSDPRLALEDQPDPDWWSDDAQDGADADPKRRQGYGNNATLPPATVGTPQREEIEDLFDMALAGFLPRTRDLKPWEPDKLNARHLQIINLKGAGLSNKKIAELLDIAEATVSVIVNHPDSQYILARMLAYAAENVVDVETRIRATAPLAHEKLVQILTTSKKEESVIKVAFGFLDRAGYGAVQKSESNETVTINVPREEASLIKAAILESRNIKDADYVVLANEILPPGSPVDSGSEGGPSDDSLADDFGMPSAEGSQELDGAHKERKTA